MTDAALVLEGGALRGVFSAGVTDVFLEKDLEFAYVNGVSAGTMCGMNYVAKQAERMFCINMEYLHDCRYMNLNPCHILRKREIFSFDFVFGELSDKLIPFHYEEFDQSPQRFEVVATRCKTGQPEFFEKGRCRDICKAVIASSSMPVFSKMAEVDGKKYLDGGISLPIAYQRAMDQGYDKVVLILTREEGYRKKPMTGMKKRAFERYFEPLPRLLSSIYEIPERYNRMQEEISKLERQGRIFVLRPKSHVTVSRTERDPGKLAALYEEGRRIAEENMDALMNYLGE